MTEITGVNLRSSEAKHANDIAKCHMKAFPNALSTLLGMEYTVQNFTWYFTSKNLILFHLEKDNEIIGYCGALINDGTLATGSASGTLQHSFGVALKSLVKKPWLLFHKELLRRYELVIKNIFMKTSKVLGSKPKQANKVPSNNHYVGLVVIGVDPKYAGLGYGSLLIEKFEDYAVQSRLSKMVLSVRKNNTRAIDVYKKNGWIINDEKKGTLSMSKKIVVK